MSIPLNSVWDYVSAEKVIYWLYTLSKQNICPVSDNICLITGHFRYLILSFFSKTFHNTIISGFGAIFAMLKAW
ncbi:MAG: hypothetical protein JXB48_03595 [Candidatus Latescibacteria bacterium]|nr:hypothetical protein [Candidatus Latescibacterota bacterium]